MLLNATVPIPAASDAHAARKLAALKSLAEHLTPDSLALLAKAAKKPGANEKLKQYAAFI